MLPTSGLHFTLFNYPVKVRYTFFLIAFLLGVQAGNILEILIWVVIVFVSILLHELGHAVTSDFYGRSPRIELYEMGGLTISTRYSLLSYPKEILISFSGPLAGFLLGGLVYGLLQFTGPVQNDLLGFIAAQLMWVNFGWGIINLIPILPLDGGQIMRNLFHWLKNPYDERTPLMISIGFGILGIILALVVLRSIYMAVIVALLTFQNFTSLRQGYPGSPYI